MSERTIPDEWVEVAARAMDSNFNPDRHPVLAEMFRDYAKAALDAAAPLIAAKALRDAADRLAETIEDADEADEFAYGYQGGKALAHMFLKTEARRIEQEDRNG